MVLLYISFLLQIIKMSLLSTPKKEDAVAENGTADVDMKCEDQETTSASGMEVGTENNKENVEETANKTFLDDIKVEAVGKEEKETDGENAKDGNVLERKVVILNIDKSKSNDEIEDYLYDNYPDFEIENFKVIRHIPFRVIVTFDTKENAERFVETPFIDGDRIGFKNKIKKLSLVEFRSQSADRRKMKLNAENGLVITCVGFKQDLVSKENIVEYMKDNHEEVTDVDMRPENVLLTFGTKAAADKFLGLTYVKYKGQIIVRQRRVEKTTVKKSPVKKEKEDRKRKHPETNKAPSACIKLKGFKNPQTTFKSIQEALDRKGVKKFDIQFIQVGLLFDPLIMNVLFL